MAFLIRRSKKVEASGYHNAYDLLPALATSVRSLAVVGLLLVLPLAGCVTPPPSGASAALAQPLARLADLSSVSPKVDAAATLQMLKDFSQSYPYRQSDTPMHEQARDALEAAFKADGLETMRQTFPSGVGLAPVPYLGQNILGIKWGADRSHWIVVGAHYDITEGAVFGTYDDGSGTILVAKLAQAFAKVDSARTIAFIEFDQEERGLVGSSYFVKSVLDGSFHAGDVANVTLDGMIDLDMVGITWPHPAHLVAWQDSPSVQNETRLLAKAAGVPDANLEFRQPRGGSSDGRSFLVANVSTIYFWSDWDDVVLQDGTHFPQPYPFWHRVDTYDTMVAMAGDEATLTKGFQTTLDIVSPLLDWMASPAFVPDSVPMQK
jgi:hypothetical protein